MPFLPSNATTVTRWSTDGSREDRDCPSYNNWGLLPHATVRMVRVVVEAGEDVVSSNRARALLFARRKAVIQSTAHAIQIQISEFFHG
mmetsp:Transcript_939/g.2194  ORF Transcript_939/g.2194 Transcript_939/m.2194 type:complete len:88 (+) Transcript_939:762-1025(+)